MHGSGWYARTSDLFEMPRIRTGRWRDAPHKEILNPKEVVIPNEVRDLLRTGRHRTLPAV